MTIVRFIFGRFREHLIYQKDRLAVLEQMWKQQEDNLKSSARRRNAAAEVAEISQKLDTIPRTVKIAVMQKYLNYCKCLHLCKVMAWRKKMLDMKLGPTSVRKLKMDYNMKKGLAET